MLCDKTIRETHERGNLAETGDYIDPVFATPFVCFYHFALDLLPSVNGGDPYSSQAHDGTRVASGGS
jgi:hypothetical protein